MCIRDRLYDALSGAASEAAPESPLREKAARFLANLARWRTFSRYRSVPELLRRLFDETGYYDYVGGLPGGLLRQANLRMLYDLSLIHICSISSPRDRRRCSPGVFRTARPVPSAAQPSTHAPP